MNFWKNHAVLRAILMIVSFITGIVLTIIGWKMTGKLEGLGLMMLGIIFLLTTLFVYNGRYKK